MTIAVLKNEFLRVNLESFYEVMHRLDKCNVYIVNGVSTEEY